MAVSPAPDREKTGITQSGWLQGDRLHQLVRYWWAFFLLCALEGFYALIRLMLIPADPKNQVILGYSASRLVLMALILLIGLGFGALSLMSWRSETLSKNWLHPQKRQKLYSRLLFPSGLLAVISLGVMGYLRLYPEGLLIAYYERFQPLLTWLSLLGMQSLLWLAVLRYGLHKEGLIARRGLLTIAGITMAAFLFIWALIAWTGIGITPDAVAWGPPGVPVLEWQVWLGFTLGVIFLAITIHWYRAAEPAKKKLIVLDIVLIILIYGAAVWSWLSLPVPRSYFAPQPRPPNFEVYPYSDAANHDIVAQHILIGNGFLDGRVVKRPLLSLFFAVLHLLAGQDYDQVIVLQTLLLATLPVILYLLGRSLHSRPAGLMMAIFALFREVNAIQATPFTRVSHSKLLLSDLPTMLGVCLFCLLAVLWLQKPKSRSVLALAGGGALGALMLIRTQSILLLLVPLIVALVIYWKQWRVWVQGAGLMLLGIILCITPWIIRNYHFTGRLVFDQMEQTGIFAQRYTDLPGYAMPERLTGETDEAYASRILSSSWEFTFRHPGEVAGFIAAHFTNNEIDTALVLPLRDHFKDLADVFFITGNFWDEWNGSLRSSQVVLLLINLALIALGVGGSIKRWGIIGLVPLFINLVYSLSNAVVRNSGWRYILPADWVGYFYFTIGVIELVILISAFFSLKQEVILRILPSMQSDISTSILAQLRQSRIIGLLVGLAILCLGLTLPLAEIVFPEKYPHQSKTEILSRLEAQESVIRSTLDIGQLEQFASKEDVTVAWGRTLYPRFYDALAGESGFGWVSFEPHDYPRIGFLVIGASDQNIILRIEKPPAYFPNVADVIVVGCEIHTDEGDFVDAAVVTFLEGQKSTYVGDGFDYSCPLEK